MSNMSTVPLLTRPNQCSLVSTICLPVLQPVLGSWIFVTIKTNFVTFDPEPLLPLLFNLCDLCDLFLGVSIFHLLPVIYTPGLCLGPADLHFSACLLSESSSTIKQFVFVELKSDPVISSRCF